IAPAKTPPVIATLIEESPLPQEDKPAEPAQPPQQVKKEKPSGGKVIFGVVIEKNPAKKEIMIDLTRDSGVEVGQSLVVVREDEKIADLEVTRVSDNYSIAKALTDNDFGAVELFDKVEFSL
ncbi:MAG: hypothetical protein V1830_01425, partial [Candidatus Omnitrophota bacterium]